MTRQMKRLSLILVAVFLVVGLGLWGASLQFRGGEQPVVHTESTAEEEAAVIPEGIVSTFPYFESIAVDIFPGNVLSVETGAGYPVSPGLSGEELPTGGLPLMAAAPFDPLAVFSISQMTPTDLVPFTESIPFAGMGANDVFYTQPDIVEGGRYVVGFRSDNIPSVPDLYRIIPQEPASGIGPWVDVFEVNLSDTPVIVPELDVFEGGRYVVGFRSELILPKPDLYLSIPQEDIVATIGIGPEIDVIEATLSDFPVSFPELFLETMETREALDAMLSGTQVSVSEMEVSESEVELEQETPDIGADDMQAPSYPGY